MSNSISGSLSKPPLDEAGKKRVVVVVIYMISTWSMLFLGAWTLHWLAGWVYVGLQTAVFLGVGLQVIRKNPAVINERGKKADNTKPWDKVFSLIFAPLLYLTPLTAGLDYHFGWSSMAFGWQIVGAALLIPGLILPYWAMLENRFLATTVRLQEEEGQYVITTGPYRFVRHPMYVGMYLSYIGAALLLASWWAFVPAGIAIAAVVGRTALEDKTLQAELPGYAQYAQQTRYRLLPGIW